MNNQTFDKIFDLSGQVVVITGGAGVLCTAMAEMIGARGAKVAILDLQLEAAQALADNICATGGEAIAIKCDVLDKPSVEAAAEETLTYFNQVDILINGAGGNKAAASTNFEKSFFSLPIESLRWVVDLNLMGTILPSQVFGEIMAKQETGIILNISSMTAFRPLTRIPAYSAAKAGVSNFTQWLAVHMAQEYSPNIRVNAISPGFFLTEQNRFLLTDKATGEVTPRGKSILEHTPQGRFGCPDDLMAAVLWLISPGSSFVTGIVVPVDGGFSAFSGV